MNKIQKYLSIKDYIYEDPMNEEDLIRDKIKYFWLDCCTLITDYKIETINGIHLYPILTEDIIYLRCINNLFFQLRYIKYLENLIYRKKYIYMSKIINNIPLELIKYILDFL